MSASDERRPHERLAKLTPAQRALLEKRLLERRDRRQPRRRRCLAARSSRPSPLSYSQELCGC